jgi:hypothetical protein
MRVILVMALVMLAGCATGPTLEELAAADDAKCTEYGYPAGHPEYGACRMLVEQMRIDAEVAQAAAQANRAASAAAAYGIYNNHLQSVTPQRRPMNTCIQSGAFTNCY